MASYYVDGTISSVSGSGSGTLADPWGKTDDLLQYAGDQILAGPGKGLSGDTIFIVAGGVNSTTTPMLDFTSSDFANLTIVGKGREQTEWDCGTENYMSSYNSTTPAGSAGNGVNLNVCNLTVNWQDNVGTVGTYNSLTGQNTNFYDCDLLLYNSNSQTGNHGKVNAHSRLVDIVNCRWQKGYNVLDSRSASRCINTVILAAPSPSFERNSYGGVWINCIFDWRLAADSVNRGITDYNPFCINCTYLLDPSHSRSAVVANFDAAKMLNCYIEGGGAIIQDPFSQGYSYVMLSNIYCYDTTSLFGNGTVIDEGYTQNLVMLSESGLKDVANGDFRPADNLIGVSTAQIPAWDLVNPISQRPTVGCYSAQNIIGKPFHPRMRG